MDSKRRIQAGYGSKLIELPPDTVPDVAFRIIQQNFEIIWKTLNDIRARLDGQKL